MWVIDKLETRPVTLDFSSSGQGLQATFALYADGVLLANALTISDLGSRAVQLLVCESCGIAGCRPGGWVCLRRAGDLVFFMPVFELMAESEHDLAEYAPPGYVAARGAPCLDLQKYDALTGLAPGFPDPDLIEPLVVGEALRFFQWDSPHKILGRFPDLPRLAEDLLLTAAEGELEPIRNFVNRYANSLQSLVPAPGVAAAEPIELLLDRPGFPSWTKFSAAGDSVFILLGDDRPFQVDN